MKKEHAVYAAIIIVVVLMGIAWVIVTRPLWHFGTLDSAHNVVLDGKTVRVTIADTDATRELGLSGHAPLAEDEGMLFVFQEDDVHKFWMKGMTFPIDIMWLTGDGTIVHLEPDVSPSTYPQSFGPETPTRYVLEVNAGYAEQNEIQVGDKAQF